ncbi:MAG: hypothetical protein AAGI37_17940 [Planctomycetota bacterium]
MAKYQDTVEILIQARDEARREMQGIRQEVARTRDEIGGDVGIVANAAKLHHALQKVSAAADGVKTGMAATRGIMLGLEGDSEGMVESFKQMGFGIGEVVNQVDQLAELIANRLHGVTKEMIDAEEEANREHAERVKLQQQQNASAEKARLALSDLNRLQFDQLQMLSTKGEAEKADLESRMRVIGVQKQLNALLDTASKDVSEQNRNRAKLLADQISANTLAIEQRKAEIREEKAKTAELEKQKQLLEQHRDAERSYIQMSMRKVREFATNALKGQLDDLREQVASVASRGSTISLGNQSGRFVTGLRDQAANREDPMIRAQQQLRESFERKIDELKGAIDQVNGKIRGDGIELVPVNIAPGVNL